MTAPQINSNHPQSLTEPLTLHCGHNAEVLKSYPDCHFDVIVTDPPYGIEFLGKAWDNHTGAIATWQQCLRVLKPGGHLLAFSAARTYHNLATNIESVGFEIRDQLMWIYSSGFPKAQDIGKSIERRQGRRANANTGDKWENASGKNSTGVNTTTCRTCERNNVTIGSQFHCDNSLCDMRERLKPAQNQWAGWKTALKPGHEPIVMARKPFRGSTIDNVLTHGVGALNIDVTRIAFEDAADLTEFQSGFQHANLQKTGAPTFQGSDVKPVVKRPTGGADRLSRLEFGEREPIKYKDQKRVIRAGRDPRNRLKDLESQNTPADHNHEETPVYEANPQGRYPSNVMGEITDYQKYFYCPKVSRRERHVGFEQSESDSLAHLPTESSMLAAVGGYYVDDQGNRTEHTSKNIWTPTTGMVYVHGLTKIYQQWCQTHNKTAVVGNNHPTVKPVALMRYLIQLVTPENSVVLDPFMGSGSTGMAASELGHRFVGIDLDPAYVRIAQKRITGWCKTETARSVQPETATDLKDTDLFDDLFE